MQLRASSRFRVSTFFSVLYYTLEIFLPPRRYIRGANGHVEREREGGRERAWTSCTRACWCIYTYFIIVVNRSGPCEIKQELLSAGYCIPRVACLNPVIVKFASDGWMSRVRNSSSEVEFNLQLNPCFFVCSQRVGLWFVSYRIEISISRFNWIYKDLMIFKFFFLNWLIDVLDLDIFQ